MNKNIWTLFFVFLNSKLTVFMYSSHENSELNSFAYRIVDKKELFHQVTKNYSDTTRLRSTIGFSFTFDETQNPPCTAQVSFFSYQPNLDERQDCEDTLTRNRMEDIVKNAKLNVAISDSGKIQFLNIDEELIQKLVAFSLSFEDSRKNSNLFEVVYNKNYFQNLLEIPWKFKKVKDLSNKSGWKEYETYQLADPIKIEVTYSPEKIEADTVFLKSHSDINTTLNLMRQSDIQLFGDLSGYYKIQASSGVLLEAEITLKLKGSLVKNSGNFILVSDVRRIKKETTNW